MACDCAYQGVAGISGPDLKGFAILAEAFGCRPVDPLEGFWWPGQA